MNPHIVLAYMAGVLTPIVGYVVVAAAIEIPAALDQARYERIEAIPRERSCLRRWAWWLLVAGRQKKASSTGPLFH